MCVSKTEAQAEANVRSRQMKLLEYIKGTVPEEPYNQSSYIYWHSKRLEDQTAALLVKAAPDEECPEGSNTQSVTFELRVNSTLPTTPIHFCILEVLVSLGPTRAHILKT